MYHVPYNRKLYVYCNIIDFTLLFLKLVRIDLIEDLKVLSRAFIDIFITKKVMSILKL